MVNFIKKYKFEIILIIITIFLMLLYDENGFFYNYTKYPDVKIYYNIGKQLFYGKQLYIDLIDVKGPYIFFIGMLSYLFNKDLTVFFLVDSIFILIFAIYTYKILKIYLNENSAFLSTLLNLLIVFSLFEYFGNIEVMLIGINSIFIYWLLNDGFNKNNKKIFFLFGIFISLIFLIKLNYLFSFGIIGIIYLIKSIKSKKNIKREILNMGLGIIIGFIPLIIYDIIHNSYFETIKNYISLCISYGNRNFIFGFNGIQFISINIIFFIISIVLIILYKKKIKNMGLILIFFICSMFSIFITKNIYYYYYYMLFPFNCFLFVLINSKNKNNIIISSLKIFFSIFMIFGFLINTLYIIDAKQINGDVQDTFEYKFYEDYKDVIDDNTIIVGIGHISNIATTYFDNQPQSKYWFNLNLSYTSYPEIYDYHLTNLANKKIDFAIVNGFLLENFQTINNYYNHAKNINLQKYCLTYNKKILLFFYSSNINNSEYIKQVTKLLNKNYKISNIYIKNNRYRHFLFYLVYQKNI